MQARAARAHHHGRRACSRARPRRARNPSARAPARHHCIHCPLLRGDPWKQMARLRAVNWPAFARCILPLNSAPARGLQLGSPNGILEALRRVACNSDLLTAIIMEPITAIFERTSRTHRADARLPQPPTNARTLAAATPAARATRRQPGARAHQPPPSPALARALS